MERWKSAENYIGSDYSEYFVGPSRHRDSDILEKVNFDVAWERLQQIPGSGDYFKAESGNDSEDKEALWTAHSSHWAVGWCECILVHKDWIAGLVELEAIEKDLNSYCILDEDRFSEAEYAQKVEDWEAYGRAECLEELGFEDAPEHLPEELELELANAWEVSGYYGQCEAVFDAYFDAWIEDARACQPGHSLWMRSLERAGQIILTI